MNLSDHPLIAYATRAAIEGGVFNDFVCITDREGAPISKSLWSRSPIYSTRINRYSYIS
jgi:hypothetical protein